MINLVATIPVSQFKTWASAEAKLKQCTGEGRAARMWFIRAARRPTKDLTNALCFMTYRGVVRGYLHIVDVAPIEEYEAKGYRFRKDKPSPYVVAMVNWTPLPAAEQNEYPGFQGWRYTEKQP